MQHWSRSAVFYFQTHLHKLTQWYQKEQKIASLKWGTERRFRDPKQRIIQAIVTINRLWKDYEKKKETHEMKKVKVSVSAFCPLPHPQNPWCLFIYLFLLACLIVFWWPLFVSLKMNCFQDFTLKSTMAFKQNKIIQTSGFIFLFLFLQYSPGAAGETSARLLLLVTKSRHHSIYTRYLELLGKSIFSLYEIIYSINI